LYCFAACETSSTRDGKTSSKAFRLTCDEEAMTVSFHQIFWSLSHHLSLADIALPEYRESLINLNGLMVCSWLVRIWKQASFGARINHFPSATLANVTGLAELTHSAL
jgi:hypothetical protein